MRLQRRLERVYNIDDWQYAADSVFLRLQIACCIEVHPIRENGFQSEEEFELVSLFSIYQPAAAFR
jgi:hypothetical protein